MPSGVFVEESEKVTFFGYTIGDWGVYTAEYVKSYFVDECQSITQEQYEQIAAAKQ